jgi:hypothetical protein
MITHLYKYMCTHPILISIFKRLSQINLKIYEFNHQERLAIDGNVIFH